MTEEQQPRRIMPQSELDLNLMMVDGVWGKPEVSMELKNRLKQVGGETAVESLWGLLGMYTRDMRLANLSTFDGELDYVSTHLDLAHDFLQSNMTGSFMVALSRAATRLELSQSKGGFLRKRMHTFTQESKTGEIEPAKKSIFGGRKKE